MPRKDRRISLAGKTTSLKLRLETPIVKPFFWICWTRQNMVGAFDCEKGRVGVKDACSYQGLMFLRCSSTRRMLCDTIIAMMVVVRGSLSENK